MAAYRPSQNLLVTVTFVFAVSCFLVECSGSYIITHAPNYLKFRQSAGPVSLGDISTLQLSSFGLSTDKAAQWNGLSATNIFKKAKANVIFSINGFDDNKHDLNLHQTSKFTTINDEPLDTTIVSDRLQGYISKSLVIDFEEHSSVFDIRVQHPSLLQDISSSLSKVRHLFVTGNSPITQFGLGSINASLDSDLFILAELQLVYEIVNALEKTPDLAKDVAPDMFHFKIEGFKELVKVYGADSDKVRDAIHLLENFLNQMTERLRKLYDADVVIQVVTMATDQIPRLVRKSRSLMAEAPPSESIPDKVGVAKQTAKEYAALFNIILWVMIVLALVILFISIGMWNMDPGRDSIIYRMTSQRIKKD